MSSVRGQHPASKPDHPADPVDGQRQRLSAHRRMDVGLADQRRRARGGRGQLGHLAVELDPVLRVVVAEEVFEFDLPLPNVAKGARTTEQVAQAS